MKLSELLDYIGSEILDDRAEMLEGASDSLWSDAAIVRQLNEYQRILCRDAWVLEDLDTTSTDTDGNFVCRIQLVEGQTDYAFHKSILKIKSVRLSDSALDLVQVKYDDNRIRSSAFAPCPDFWDVNSVQSETSGRPSRWSSDMGTRIIRVRQQPDATAALLTLNFAVVRMPIRLLSLKDIEAEPEVPEEYHMLIANAAGGRLLQNPNVDTRLQSIGRAWTDEFDNACKEARRDRERRQIVEPRMRAGGWANDSYGGGGY